MIGQQGGGGGGVSADDELQVVWRLGDQWNDEAAVKVSGPYVVDLEDRKQNRLAWLKPVGVSELQKGVVPVVFGRRLGGRPALPGLPVGCC